MIRLNGWQSIWMYIGILVVHRVSISWSRFIVEVRGRANYPSVFLNQTCSSTREAELSWLADPSSTIHIFMTAKLELRMASARGKVLPVAEIQRLG